jgi:hypothetical protein
MENFKREVNYVIINRLVTFYYFYNVLFYNSLLYATQNTDLAQKLFYPR